MKRLTALLCSAALLLCGCQSLPTVTPTLVTQTDPPVQSTVSEGSYTLELDREQLRTWSDLHDYLESPLRSGERAFNGDAGEYVVLYRTDWITPVADWDTPLEEDMMVIRYAADDTLLDRMYLHFAEEEAETASAPAKKDKTRKKSPASAAKTSVQTLYIYGDAALKAATKAYRKQNTNPAVELTVGEPLTAEELGRLLKQEHAPQLVIMSRREMAAAAANGYLTDWVTAGGDRLEPLMDPVCWARSEVKNGRYGLPIGCVVGGWACNLDILQQTGCTVPLTREDLLTAARKVHQQMPGAVPIGLATDSASPADVSRQFCRLLWGYGQDLLSGDNRTAAFATEKGTAAMTMLSQLYREDLVTDGYAYRDFYEGNTAFGPVTSDNYRKTFGQGAKNNFVLLSGFTLGQDTHEYFEEYCFCLTAAAGKNAAAVTAMVTWWYENNELLELCRQRDWLPAETALRGDAYFDTDTWRAFAAAVPESRQLPAVRCSPVLEEYFTAAVTRILQGEDPAAVLAHTKEKTDRRLGRL